MALLLPAAGQQGQALAAVDDFARQTDQIGRDGADQREHGVGLLDRE